MGVHQQLDTRALALSRGPFTQQDDRSVISPLLPYLIYLVLLLHNVQCGFGVISSSLEEQVSWQVFGGSHWEGTTQES